MSNELTRTGDTVIINFSDANYPIVTPAIPITQACIDALVIAKVGIGITDASVLTAIHNIFLSGEYGYSAITAEMRTIVPSTITIQSFFDFEGRVQNQWLAERQKQYFQSVQLGGITSSKTAGAEAYDKIFDEDLPEAMARHGLTREKMLGRLEMMMFSEDDKVSIQAIKMISDMSGDGHVGKVHADRRRKENGAKVKLAMNAVKQMGGEQGSVHDAQNAAAMEAHKMTMRKVRIISAEVID